MRWYFSFILFLFTTALQAQTYDSVATHYLSGLSENYYLPEIKALNSIKAENLICSKGDTLNKMDANGLKQGLWIYYSIDTNYIDVSNGEKKIVSSNSYTNFHLMNDIMPIPLKPYISCGYSAYDPIKQGWFITDTNNVQVKLGDILVYGLYRNGIPIGKWKKINLKIYSKGTITYHYFEDGSFSVLEEVNGYDSHNDAMSFKYSADTAQVSVDFLFFNPVISSLDTLDISCTPTSCQITYKEVVKETFDRAMFLIKLDELTFISYKEIMYRYEIYK